MTCHYPMFAWDHNNLKCSISPECWWHQFKIKIVWQEMILRALYYRCLNCFCLWLFPGNEYKWIEKCRWTWTASGEIDSTVADISMLKTEMGVKEAETGGTPSRTLLCSHWMLFGWEFYSLFYLASLRLFIKICRFYFQLELSIRMQVMLMWITTWLITLYWNALLLFMFSTNCLCMHQTCAVNCFHIS